MTIAAATTCVSASVNRVEMCASASTSGTNDTSGQRDRRADERAPRPVRPVRQHDAMMVPMSEATKVSSREADDRDRLARDLQRDVGRTCERGHRRGRPGGDGTGDRAGPPQLGAGAGRGPGLVGRCGNSGGRGNECRGHRNGSSRCTGPLPASHPWLRTADRPEDTVPKILATSVRGARDDGGRRERPGRSSTGGPDAQRTSRPDRRSRCATDPGGSGPGRPGCASGRPESSLGTGVHASDVDAGLSERRSLVVTWLHRGTLQLVGADDYWWLHPLTTPQVVVRNRTRLHQEGVSDRQAERGVEVIVDALRAKGVQTRAELRRRLDAAHVPTKGQAFVHVLLAASLRSDVVRGPMRGGEHAFVAASDWLGDAPEPLERSDALARLARRYLEGHGPADARDLAKWAGLTLGDARRGFGGIAAEVVDASGRTRRSRRAHERTRAPQIATTQAATTRAATTQAATTRCVRSTAARLGVAGTVRRIAPRHRDDERPVPAVRAGRRAGRRHVGVERIDADGEASGTTATRGGEGTPRRCRRRSAFPRSCRPLRRRGRGESDLGIRDRGVVMAANDPNWAEILAAVGTMVGTGVPAALERCGRRRSTRSAA